jgi:SMC interacting uncharacterized protein involved in chromosome segregation
MPGPVDWDSFGKKASSAAKDAADKTNDELSGQLSRLTRLTEAEISQLAPTLADKEQLAKLMTIVNSATDHNKKVADIVKNAEDFGKIVLRMGELVSKVIL